MASNVIDFHTRKIIGKRSAEIRRLRSMADLGEPDPWVDKRAAQLMDDARAVVRMFPAEAVAEMIAYAAARLERTGFRML
jgi:hypothetical protein